MPSKQTDEVIKAYQDARTAPAWMVAVWSVKDGKVNLFRKTEAFPLADVPTALELLRQELDRERT
jgi:hypothetical protein